MDRRHVVLVAVAVATFVAGGIAYALDLSRSTTASSSANPLLPHVAPAAGASAASTALNTAPGTDPAQVPGVVGFLSASARAVAYLSWQVDASGSISGTLNTATISGTPPNEKVVPDINQAVSGQISGSTISVQVGGQTDTGTVANGTLTLNVVQQDGIIAPVSFSAATPARYDAALASLGSTVDSENGQAQTAANIQQTINQLGKDYQALGSAQSSLAIDVAKLQVDLNTTSNDLSSEKTAENGVISEASNGTDPNTVCSDAYTVASDGYTVQSDSYTFSSDLNSATSDLGSLRSALPQVQADLEAVQAVDPSYAGSGGAPSPQDATSEMGSARGVAVQQVVVANSRIDTVNGYLASAQTYAAGAAHAGNCSGPDSAPTPITHVS